MEPLCVKFHYASAKTKNFPTQYGDTSNVASPFSPFQIDTFISKLVCKLVQVCLFGNSH